MFNSTTAPVEFTLGGKKRFFHPLTFHDIASIDNHIRARCIESARASLNENSSAEERAETLDAAFRLSSTMSFVSKEGSKYVETFDGLCFMAKLSLQHHDPKITDEEVAEMLSDRDTMMIFSKMIQSQFETKRSDPTKTPALKKGARRKPSR